MTFSCEPTVSLTATPPLSGLAFEHDPLDPIGQNVPFSTYTLSVGAPCYEVVGYTVTDDTDASNADAEFIYDDATSILSIIGTELKINTQRTYTLHLIINDMNTSLFHSQLILDSFTVAWSYSNPCEAPLNYFTPS